jgi:hypothetical protein
MSLFTLVHVLISLIGIAAGFVVLYGMLTAKRLPGWTATFLAMTLLTSVTGFFFPFHKLMPSHILGVISLVVLAIAIPARYIFHMAGPWRKTYVITSMMAQYFNVFVLIAQAFQKVPALKALAPTQSEPPFLMSQLVVMVIFIALIIAAAIRFLPEPAAQAPPVAVPGM